MARPRLHILRKGDLTEERDAHGAVVYFAVLDLELGQQAFNLGQNRARAHEIDFELRRQLRDGMEIAAAEPWLAGARSQPPQQPVHCASVLQLADAYLASRAPGKNKRQVFLAFLRVLEVFVRAGRGDPPLKHCYGGKVVTTADYPDLEGVTVEILLTPGFGAKYIALRQKGLTAGTPQHDQATRSAVCDLECAREIFTGVAMDHYRQLRQFTLPNVLPFLTEAIGMKIAPAVTRDFDQLAICAQDAVRAAELEDEGLFRCGVLALGCGLTKGNLVKCHTDHLKATDAGYLLKVGKGTGQRGFLLAPNLGERLLSSPGFVLPGKENEHKRTEKAEEASIYYADKLGVDRGLTMLRKLYTCHVATTCNPVDGKALIGWTSVGATQQWKSLPRLSVAANARWADCYPATSRQINL